MTVAQLDVIDFIATKPDTNEIFLIITDSLKWDFEDHIDTLKSKVNAYVKYINSDALLDVYPDAKAKKLVIEVLYDTEPNSQALDAFAVFKKMGDSSNFRFSHRLER